MSLPAFGFAASSSDLVKSDAGMTAVLPSGVVTVAFPLSSTITSAPGFTALTLSAMAFLASSLSGCVGSTTTLSAGLTMSLPAFGFAASSGDLNKSLAGIVAVVPSFRVTVAFPFSSNLTDLAVGFKSFNFSSTLA